MNHSEIILKWPGGMKALAEDMGVPFNTARGWKARNSIPSVYWKDLLSKAREREVYVTHDDLTISAARRRAS